MRITFGWLLLVKSARFGGVHFLVVAKRSPDGPQFGVLLASLSHNADGEAQRRGNAQPVIENLRDAHI